VASDAHVDAGLGLGRDDVLRRAAANHTDIYGDAARVVVQVVQGEHLVRELLDGADALLAVGAGVRGAAGDRETEAAQPLS
jgi:hypothetical protein